MGFKIAIVSDAIYPYNKGGKEKRIHELSTRLTDEGYEVHIYTMNWWGGDKCICEDGVYLHGVCGVKDLYTPSGRRSIFQALYFSFHMFFPLFKQNFDLVDVDQMPYLPIFPVSIYCMLRHIPLVVTWHEVWGDYWYRYMGWAGFFGKTIEKICSRLTNNNVAVSETTKSMIMELGVKKKVHVIPNGVDIQEIQKIKPSEEEFDVLFVGRLIKEKNVDILIKSIKSVSKEIPEVKAVIIGEGPEGERLKSLAGDLDLEDNIKFLGFLPNYDDVISYIKSSKVFVLPSTREGFGIVLLEAMACGLPVITVDHPMNAAKGLIIDGENGFKGDLSEEFISRKTIKLLKNEHLRNNMFSYSVDYAKKYDWDAISGLLEGFYNGEVIKI